MPPSRALDRLRRAFSGHDVDPRRPHDFKGIDEMTAIGASNRLGTYGSPQAGAAFVISEAARDVCHLPGCGKPARDAVHQ